MKTRYTRVATMRPFSNILDSCRRGPMRNIVLHGQDNLRSEPHLGLQSPSIRTVVRLLCTAALRLPQECCAAILAAVQHASAGQ